MQLQGDSVATFYADLVNVPAVGVDDANGQAGSGSEGRVDQQNRQQLQQQLQQQQPQQQASTPFKPVQFTQPVVLDPNTGVVSLPLKASYSQHQHQNEEHPPVQIQPPRSKYVHATSSLHSSQAALQLDQASQGRRHRTASARSAGSTPADAAAHPAAPSAAGSNLKRPIDSRNVGYQLLQKAGWREGRGLGRQEQGMAAPLQLQPQKGSKGLGFAPPGPLQLQQQQAAAAGSAAVAPADPAVGPVLGGKRVAALVAAELASEDLDTKVKRHRQLLEQEAKDERDKAIQLYVQRAFNEPSLADVGDHANVLGRNSRLTRTNPLLEDEND